MKKRNGIALALCMALCLSGCGGAGAAASELPASAAVSENASSAPAAGSLQSENERLKAENEQLRSQLAAARSKSGPDPEQDNPIDALFDRYDQVETTYGMVTVSSAECTAWHDELAAFVRDMESQTTDAADKTELETYLGNAEAQAKILAQMIYMTSAGPEVPRAKRAGSSGTLAPVLIASGGAQIYEDAFYGLYNLRYAEESDWKWHFDSAAAKQALDARLAKAG